MSSRRAPLLRDLSDIISSAVDRIENALDAQSLDFPSPDTPYTKESESPRNIPEVFDAVNTIIAAAGQLTAVARAPALTVFDIMFMVRHLFSAFRS